MIKLLLLKEFKKVDKSYSSSFKSGDKESLGKVLLKILLRIIKVQDAGQDIKIICKLIAMGAPPERINSKI